MLACIRSIASTPYVFSGHSASFGLANSRSATTRIGLPESFSICCNSLDLRVDMGKNFPYSGPYDRMKASTVLPRWECSINVPTVMARYGGVLTSLGGMMRGV